MKKLTLFILLCWPLLFAGSICNVVVGQGVAAPAASCDLSSTMKQETNADYWSGEGVNAQKVKNSSAITICKIGVMIDRNGADATYHIEIWSAGTANAGANMGGDAVQLGVDSPNFTTSTAGATWYEVEWTTDMPEPTGDYFVHVCPTGGSSGTNRFRMGATADAYENTSYDYWRGSVGSAADFNYDMCFRVYCQ